MNVASASAADADSWVLGGDLQSDLLSAQRGAPLVLPVMQKKKTTSVAAQAVKQDLLKEREQRRLEQLKINAELRRKAQVLEPPLAALVKTNAGG